MHKFREKKYSMYRLPTNIERRKKWIKNINRSDLHPKNLSCMRDKLYEIHFASEIWERRWVDGKKKLKSSTIPTIFPWKTNTNVASMDSTSANTDINITTLNGVDEELTVNLVKQDIQETISTNNIAELTINIPNEQAETVTQTESTLMETIFVPLNTMHIKNIIEESEKKSQKALLEARQAKLKLQQANKIITKLDKSRRMLIKRLDQKTKLTKKMHHLHKNIRKILNDDQMKTLCTPSERCDRWSNDTLKKALRLKLSCGSNGYAEILRQGIPLPSERTLRRRLEAMDFQPGVSKKIFDILNERVSLFTDD